jgi:hypothetical protein
MRVTKLFVGLGLAAALGLLCPNTVLARGGGGHGGGFGGGGFHGGGIGGGFHGGGIGGFHGGGASFGGFHGLTGGSFHGGSAFRSGTIYHGTRSFSGIPHALAYRSLPGTRFNNSFNSQRLLNFSTHNFGNTGSIARYGNFRGTISRPVNPQTWRHNGTWWNHTYVWNGHNNYYRYGRYPYRYHYYYPGGSSWYWYPLWWGINPYLYGYYGNYWPYYAYDYGYSPGYYTTYYSAAPADEGETAAMAAQPAATVPEAAEAAGNSDWGKEFIVSAKEAFRQGEYADALRLASHAAVEMPRDAKPHVLMSQALFALGDYQGANLEAHAVLSLGSAPDWPTLYAYYGNVETYTKQLDKLADYIRKNPDASDARFVLGFQDLVLGHKDAALTQFEKVIAKVPQDKLAIAQIKDLGGTVTIKTPIPPKPAVTPETETTGPGAQAL